MKIQPQKLRSAQVILIFLGLSLLLRFFSFFPTVLDHDESTYIVISDTILAGHTYQVDYIDTKPVGIFLVFAFLQLLVGKSIFLLRMVSALVVAMTAFFLYRAKLNFGSRKESAIAAGAIFIFLNSIFTHYGISPNTETYFNLFTAGALWMFLSRSGYIRYFLAGLLLGLGFMIKYMVLFDGTAFGIFLLWQAWRDKHKLLTAATRAVLMMAGAAIPFLVVLISYHQMGHLDEFWFYSRTVSGRYPTDAGLWVQLKFCLDFFLRFLPITILFVVVLLNRHAPRDQKHFGLLWSIFVLGAVLISGKTFGHYFIQFLLPFSFLAGEFFGISRAKIPKFLQWTRKTKTGWIVLGLLVLSSISFQYLDCYEKQDAPREIASYLETHLDPDETFYTTNDQVVYHLLDQLPPIPYVHPSLFWEERHIQNLEIDVENEMEKLMRDKPQFLLIRKPLDTDRFETWMSEYELVETIAGRTDIYKRKE